MNQPTQKVIMLSDKRHGLPFSKGLLAQSFTATWYASDTVTPPATTPPVVYSNAYNSFWALAQEEGDSRIWGGIHFRFEIDASLESCADVADYLFENYMQPL